ncbi:hypothetical protein TWF569_005902 [Orbilia oligospora]|uniref:Phospholipase/carboxylesterase/thioesterase domain-containing protein n=1 Tax=Orbilia oligospora TaxID=2813651 RepID=A0A7C8JI88_ORBOL|nr:hypothetical protein TWF102_008003 [Orbilia oligospora]KAF3103346.1 hypothetical protein TWF706_004953 [Orbilia oligospora]KAF3108826.1 hypothetical protein TWF103_005419 [Orbilia oligospora]KAF3119567.1 hypothetical protein TWF703_003277 [Orbilia oligospora]KAF3148169.1 hypothetical protein TWF569_005902 [Orbilia oligospora]
MNSIQSHEYSIPHIIHPSAPGRHTSTIIFLHGRGSGGLELADELGSSKISGPPDANIFSQLPHVKWVFPTAKPRFSTIFQEEATEWFDIYSLSDPSERSELQIEGLREAVLFLRDVIDEEIGILKDSKSVFLGGISQGEATGLMLLLTGGYSLGGFMGFSGWMPFAQQIQNETMTDSYRIPGYLNSVLGTERETNGRIEYGMPILMGHGRDDACVDSALGSQARDILQNIGYKVEWCEYEGAEQEGHWFKEPEGLDDIVRFLKEKCLILY